MALPTTSTFGQFVLKVGDGATPEVFTVMCGLTSKGFDITNNTSSTMVPDCEDEDLPSYEEQDVKSQMASVKGSGIFTVEGQKDLLDWVFNGTKKNVRLYPGKAETGDVEYYMGPAICKSLGLSVAKGDKVTQSIDLVFSSKPTAVIKA